MTINTKKLQNIHKALFFALIVLIPTQLGYHFWPEWAHVLGRRVDYLAPTIYLTDVLIIATLVSWFVSIHRISKRAGFRVPPVRRAGKPGMTATTLVFFLFIFVNIFFSSSPSVAMYRWIKVLEFAGLGFYIIKTKVQLSSLRYPLSVGILYSSLIAIGQFMIQHSIGGPLWWFGERTFGVDTSGIAKFQSCQLSAVSPALPAGGCQLLLRPYATFPHPNVLGGYLAVLLPGIIQYTNNPIIKLSNTKKIFYFVTFAMGIVALVLTFSRSAIIVGLIAIVVTLIKIKNKTAFVIGFLFFLSLITYRVLPLDQTSESVVVREQLNAAAIKVWQQSPIIGIGLGNFLIKLPEVLPSRTIYFLQPVHNIYLLLLAETGVAGLVLFLWLLWQALKKETGDRRQETGSLVACRLSLVALLILGLVDHYPLTLQQGQLLFTLLLSFSMIQ